MTTGIAIRTTQHPQSLHTSHRRFTWLSYVGPLRLCWQPPERPTITTTRLATSGPHAVTFATGAASTTNADTGHSHASELPSCRCSLATKHRSGRLVCNGTCMETYAAANPLVISPLGSRSNLQDHPVRSRATTFTAHSTGDLVTRGTLQNV